MNASAKAGRYELIEEIGRGAMGVVYRANDPVIGRPVAVKTMRLANPGNGLSHEEMLSRFQTEARAAGLLTHPNIVVVYDAGEEDGVLYITMELVDGPSLQSLIEARQSFPLPRVLRVMEQACSALDYAHQHKIIHRDIKPANLMLTPDDSLKITDFGTAKILQFGTMQTAQAIGTPSYMSPEQIKGRPVDGRADIFSLGVVLYELVTGQKPFPGESVTTVIYKIVNENPLPPRELDASIHPGLSAIVTKALAKLPEERFQSCRELADALRNYAQYRDAALESTMVLPRPSTPGANADPARMLAARGGAARVGTPSRTLRPSLSGSAPAKSRTSPWLALLLFVVIGAAGYEVFPAVREIWQRSQPDRDAAENALRSATLTSKAAETTPPAPSGAGPSQAQGSPDAPQDSAAAPSASASDIQQSPNAQPSSGVSASAPASVTESDADAIRASPSAEPSTSVPTIGTKPANANRSTNLANATAQSADRKSPLKEVTQPLNPAPYKPSKLPPTLAAAAWQTRIWRILVQSGIDGRVQVSASGNTLTLTGSLGIGAHRRLLARLSDIPDRVQVVDDIEYSDEPVPLADTTQGAPGADIPRR